MTNNPWFEATLYQSVDRLRASETTDEYGSPTLDWSAPDTVTMPAVLHPPILRVRLGSHAADEATDGRDAVRHDLECWFANDDVTALDRVVFDGRTYEIMGQPGHRADLDGNYEYTKVLLREVSG